MSEQSVDSKSQSRPKSWLDRIFNLFIRKPQTSEQLVDVLHDAESRGVLSTEMLGMLECSLQVAQMQVREVMVPKAQMIIIHKNDELKDILPIVTETGHSRFPVFDEQGKEVVGILLAKDLLKYNFNREVAEFSMGDVLRPAVFTPQSKRLNVLLREFRVNRNHIAIVLDEYGHVAGLVTIEDVLEQIVGEIEDEYDIEEENSHIKKLEDGTYIVKASTLIEDFNEYFHTEVSDEEFDTIGGIVLQAFGHVPKRGEVIKIRHFKCKVLHSDNRRVYLLEIKLMKPKKKTSE